ncbi:MAG: TetR/AcrR family transcriptional regulator, partial [Nitrospirae bacterium]
QSLSIEDALFEIGVSFFNTLKERQGLVRIMLSEINLYPEKIRQIYTRFIEEMVDTLAGFFRSQQSRGVIRDFDAKTGARIFLGMVFSFFQSEVILQGKRIGPERVKKTLRRYVDIFLKGVMV